jgi:TPP-dependent pyruvate/acetoin dehydrogenase alpha subunit
MTQRKRPDRRRRRGRSRRISVRGVRREPIDKRRLSRAVIDLAVAQAEADAQAEAEAREQVDQAAEAEASDDH